MYSALVYVCRSQWPRGLRRTSASVRLLILWVRIPPGAWMSLCCAVCFQVEVSLTGWSLVHRGVLPTVMRCCVWARNLVNEEAMAYWGGGGGYRHQIYTTFMFGCHRLPLLWILQGRDNSCSVILRSVSWKVLSKSYSIITSTTAHI